MNTCSRSELEDLIQPVSPYRVGCVCMALTHRNLQIQHAACHVSAYSQFLNEWREVFEVDSKAAASHHSCSSLPSVSLDAISKHRCFRGTKGEVSVTPMCLGAVTHCRPLSPDAIKQVPATLVLFSMSPLSPGEPVTVVFTDADTVV